MIVLFLFLNPEISYSLRTWQPSSGISQSCQSDTFKIVTIWLHIFENIGIPFLSFIVWTHLEKLNNCDKIWQLCRWIWQPCQSDTFENVTIQHQILENLDIPFWSFVVSIHLEKLINYHKIWQLCRWIWQPCQSDTFENVTIQLHIFENADIPFLSLVVCIHLEK